jgi:hypothetical protein
MKAKTRGTQIRWGGGKGLPYPVRTGGKSAVRGLWVERPAHSPGPPPEPRVRAADDLEEGNVLLKLGEGAAVGSQPKQL